MSKVRSSGTASFNIEVPYKLVETGESGPKPLIVYLHGYKQNLKSFANRTKDLLTLEAYHLLLQGPYPIYDEKQKREVSQWGRAWYLYDGQQDQFMQSMEASSKLIQRIINLLLPEIDVSRICMLGYSMGGYLAGYFALSRPGFVKDLVVIGGRIKTEHFTDRSYEGLQVLALHGSKDQAVAAQRERESCNYLQKLGAAVTFQIIDEGHRLTTPYIKKVIEWLSGRAYKTAD